MNITFFYPSIELGGAELLFARMAIFLSTKGHEITVIDSNKKIMFNLCEGYNLLRKTIDSDERILVENTHLVVFANNTFNLNDYLDIAQNVSFLFWNVHPLNVILIPPLISGFLLKNEGVRLKWFNSFFFWVIYKKRREFIKKAIEKRAFFIMDGECCNAISNHYSLALDKNENVFLPVPITLANNKTTISEINKNTIINIFWYGRLCDFKYHALLRLVDELSECNFSFKLHIIGDGDKSDLVINKCTESNIDFKHYGTLENSVALQLIANTAQCVFAMGTSALECASLGIPTILAPVSYTPIKRKIKYEWLYETKQYTLGRFIQKEDYFGDVGFETILNKMLHDYQNIASASKDYVVSNHDISVIAQQLIGRLKCSNITKNDLVIENKGFIYHSYHFLKKMVYKFLKR